MFDDPERYEHDDFYEEDTVIRLLSILNKRRKTPMSNNSRELTGREKQRIKKLVISLCANSFGTMRKKPLTIFPKRSEGSGRTKLFLLTMIRIPKKPNYPNRTDGRLQKKNSLSKNWGGRTGPAGASWKTNGVVEISGKRSGQRRCT